MLSLYEFVCDHILTQLTEALRCGTTGILTGKMNGALDVILFQNLTAAIYYLNTFFLFPCDEGREAVHDASFRKGRHK